jgi:hypothetical protein
MLHREVEATGRPFPNRAAGVGLSHPGGSIVLVAVHPHGTLGPVRTSRLA